MSERKWHSGPPPHVGWWNASWNNDSSIWRWWNGKEWSDCVSNYRTAKVASRYAKLKDNNIAPIKWTYRWPKNARVPRIKP